MTRWLFPAAIVGHLLLRTAFAAERGGDILRSALDSASVAFLGGAMGLLLGTVPLLALEAALVAAACGMAIGAGDWIRSGTWHRLGSLNHIAPIEIASIAAMLVAHGQCRLAATDGRRMSSHSAWLAAALGMGALTLTLTRSAILACLACCLIVWSRRPTFNRLLVLPALCVVLLCLRMGGATNFSSSTKSAVSRAAIWREATRQMARSMPVGLGVDGFEMAVVSRHGSTTDEQIIDDPKSSYLLPATDFGLAGCCLSILMVIGALTNAAVFLRSGEERVGALALFAMVGIFDSLFVGPKSLLCVLGVFLTVGASLRAFRSHPPRTFSAPTRRTN